MFERYCHCELLVSYETDGQKGNNRLTNCRSDLLEFWSRTEYAFTKIAADSSITPSRISSKTRLNGKTCFDAQRGVTQNQ